MGNTSLNSICLELQAVERRKKEAIKEEFESRILDLEDLLNIQMTKCTPNNNYEIYTGLSGGKEIRIGGERYSKLKKILIFDILTLTVIYSGQFTESATHYASIIKAYNKRGNKQANKQVGYYKKHE